jgi:hypothetical protein
MIHKPALHVMLASCAIACARGTGTDILGGASGDEPNQAHVDQPSSPPAETSASSAPPATAPTSTVVSGSYALDVACSDLPVLNVCILSSQADKDVPFTLPHGTRRSSIEFAVEPHGPDANGSVDWAGTDPHDATVHMHGYAGPVSSVHIEVTAIIAVPDP